MPPVARLPLSLALFGIMLAAPHEARGEPVALSLLYTGEVWANVSGGLEEGQRQLHYAEAALDFDGEALLGLAGSSARLSLFWSNGESVSEIVGDAQALSNIEAGEDGLRLLEAFVQQNFSTGTSVKLGVFDLNAEFDAIEPAGLFIQSGHGVGSEFGQSGANGPSIFPTTALGMRLEQALTENLAIRAALMDGAPGDPADSNAFADLSVRDGDGALSIVEVDWRTGATRVGGGYWRYSDDVESFDGVPRSGSDGAYAFISHRLQENGARATDAWVRLGVADQDTYPIERYFGAGIVRTGLLAGRPDDSAGLAVAVAAFGESWRDFVRSEGFDAAQSEIALEATYRAQITEWLGVQPDLQYIIHPGGDASLEDAVVIGLRIDLSY